VTAGVAAQAGPPVLVGCAHGTRDSAGRRAMARVRLDVAALRLGLDVVAASVDVQRPALPDVVARLSAQGRRCVVVPLLLSAGYHVHVDVAEAVAASGGLAVAADALGPDDALVELLAQRLREAGATASDALVLAAAGSSDVRAVADVEKVARSLAERLGAPVQPSYLSAARPTVAQAVSAARDGGRPVTVATYLLSPGFFADRLAFVGADRVTAPLAPHPLLAELVLRRRAAAAHQSLQEYLLARLIQEADTPTIDEVIERAGGRAGGHVPFATAADIVRNDRAGR
jgi:sirohydrochlorin ferrochelatase